MAPLDGLLPAGATPLEPVLTKGEAAALVGQLESSPSSLQLEKASTQQKDPGQPRINKLKMFNKVSPREVGLAYPRKGLVRCRAQCLLQPQTQGQGRA